MRLSRPGLAGILASTLLASACVPVTARTTPAPAPTQVQAAPADRLVLLGTGGGPIARIGRSQPANLLQVNGKSYLIDIGDGTPRQLVRAGVRLNQIDGVFITHLHFDHTAGAMGFLALDWQDRRKQPVTFFGPPGTRELVERTLGALAGGEAIFRPQLPDLPAMDSVFLAQDWDVTTAREVWRNDGLKVTAVENSHYGTMHLEPTGHGIDRAYSFRFDTAARSIVITGDTGPSQAVEALASNVDLLVSEIIDIDAISASLARRQAATGVDQTPLVDHMKQEHLTPENVGRMAANARAKKLVLTHFATPPGIETYDREAILAAIRKHYAGPVEFGEDLASY